MRQETKADRFRRVAEARTNKILSMIRLLGNCSNQLVYTYQKEQIEQIFTTIRAETDKALQRFMYPDGTRKKRFFLSEPEESTVKEEKAPWQKISIPDTPMLRLPLPDGTALVAEVFDRDEYPAICISWEANKKRSSAIKSELLCTAEYNPDRSLGHEICVLAYQAHEQEAMYCKPFIMEEKEEEKQF